LFQILFINLNTHLSCFKPEFMNKLFFLFCGIFLSSCIVNKTNDDLVIEIADSFCAFYIEHYPENASSICSSDKYKISDIEKREKYIDEFYDELLKIDELKITDQSNKIVYLVLKEILELHMELRVCKTYLWNLDYKYGIQHKLVKLAEGQEVETGAKQRKALKRWGKVPDYIYTEISNQRIGLEQGYRLPKAVIKKVVQQIELLITYDQNTSPLLSPARRSNDKNFTKEWNSIYNNLIVSLKAYQDFLNEEYLALAPSEFSLSNFPKGRDCYKAFLKANTNLNLSPDEVYEMGLEMVERNENELVELGTELYYLKKVEDIIKKNNQNLEKFDSKDQIERHANFLIESSKKECEKWFSNISINEIVLTYYEKYESGLGEYVYGNPAKLVINLPYQIKSTKADLESLIFHEVYPGHHLQTSIEKETDLAHPILKLIQSESYSEGWATYSEQLVEEMDIDISNDYLIERRVWYGKPLAMDIGIHYYGWTKEQAIKYLTDYGIERKIAYGLYYRSVIWPGQLCSYYLGGEEFIRLRRLAEERSGGNFDIKEFHSQLFSYGNIPLSALRSLTEEWINN